MTLFVKNHEILFSYSEENEEQIPWKHNVYCDCETCSSYFTVQSTIVVLFITLKELLKLLDLVV